ncbi:hypothetical protein ElyMa_005001200 [Elysia marginata]|uniref:Uncharacterized protein n=1 Tax=Elysia marginata TaxID=1093978 RepID=A0AAV4J7C9_9GAST|nr:hypothetical protein ElyMa_005001200 [Elysia marginata]
MIDNIRKRLNGKISTQCATRKISLREPVQSGIFEKYKMVFTCPDVTILCRTCEGSRLLKDSASPTGSNPVLQCARYCQSLRRCHTFVLNSSNITHGCCSACRGVRRKCQASTHNTPGDVNLWAYYTRLK